MTDPCVTVCEAGPGKELSHVPRSSETSDHLIIAHTSGHLSSSRLRSRDIFIIVCHMCVRLRVRAAATYQQRSSNEVLKPAAMEQSPPVPAPQPELFTRLTASGRGGVMDDAGNSGTMITLNVGDVPSAHCTTPENHFPSYHTSTLSSSETCAGRRASSISASDSGTPATVAARPGTDITGQATCSMLSPAAGLFKVAQEAQNRFLRARFSVRRWPIGNDHCLRSLLVDQENGRDRFARC